MKHSFLEKVIKSFNPEFFREIAFQPLGQSFKYLLFLFLILTLLLSFKLTTDFSKGVKEIAKNLPYLREKLRDIPEITIEKGKVTSPKQSFMQEWGKFVFVIDPQGEVGHYLTLVENYEEGGLVILEDRVIVGSQERGTEIHNISEEISYLNLKFDGRGKEELLTLNFDGKVFQPTLKEINHWLEIAPFMFFPLCFLFIFCSFWIRKLIQIFGFSLLSLIVNKVKRVGLNYQHLLNIGIFALTLPLVLETLVKLSGVSVPHFNSICFVLYTLFLIIGILRCKAAEPLTKEMLK